MVTNNSTDYSPVNHAVQIGGVLGTLVSLPVGTNGQLLIGATGADPIFGTLTSTGGSITITPGPNTLNIDDALGSGRFPITPFVVGPIGLAGYQTIQSAINAAVAAGGVSQAVYVQPGTYTENLDFSGTSALSDGLTIQAVSALGDLGQCEIIGHHTPPTSTNLIVRNFRLTDPTHVFTSAAAGTTHFIIIDAFINVANGYFFDLPNWAGTFELFDTNPGFGNQDGGINNATGGSTLALYEAGIGVGTSHTMQLSGAIFSESAVISCPINFNTGSSISIDSCVFQGPLTFSGSSTGAINSSRISSGATAAVTMSSSAAIQIGNTIITSSHNPAIAGAGAGTLSLNNITFTSNTATAGTLTIATTGGFYPPGNLSTAGYVLTSNGTGTVPTFQASGISTAVEDVNVQTGTSPITPTANAITINGAVVAAGTNPVRTHGTAASVMAVEVQIAQAIAATDATKIGLANFNSAQFTVDANGFVSITGGGAAVETINGDTGSATGATITFTTGGPTANGTALFAASGSTVTLVPTVNATGNTGWGQQSLSKASGVDNTAFGVSTLLNVTTGTNNTAFGEGAGQNLITGTFNTLIGPSAGTGYTGAESSNICVNNLGTVAESNTIRIGSQGASANQQNKCFIAGITGVTTSNSNYVTLDTTTGQLGAVAIPTSLVTWTDTSGAFAAAKANGYFITTTATGTLPAAPAEGDTISFIVDTTNVLTIQANTGQLIRVGATISAAAGTAKSNARGDSITLVYRTSGTTWFSLGAPEGTWTVT